MKMDFDDDRMYVVNVIVYFWCVFLKLIFHRLLCIVLLIMAKKNVFQLFLKMELINPFKMYFMIFDFVFCVFLFFVICVDSHLIGFVCIQLNVFVSGNEFGV